MSAQLLSKILASMNTDAKVSTATKNSRKWHQDMAKQFKNVEPSTIMKMGGERFKNRVYPGHMYLFYYDPKLKKELPYYDKFPLIFPLSAEKGGFTGINLHYLPPSLRAKLMDALYELEVVSKNTKERKLRISYDILQSASKFKLYKPCIKRYLTSHVRSRFIDVPPAEWETVIFLPVERFEKASKTKVWKDSLETIKAKTASKPTKSKKKN